MTWLPDPVPCERCGDRYNCGWYPQLWDYQRGVEIAPRRLLCKACGRCWSKSYGEIQTEPNGERGYWDLRVPGVWWLTPVEVARCWRPVMQI